MDPSIPIGSFPSLTCLRPTQGLDDSGFVWYTNYESRKGQELEAAGAGAACLTFWWGDLEVRFLSFFLSTRPIESFVTLIDVSVADADFSSTHATHSTDWSYPTLSIVFVSQRSVRVEGAVERVAEAER